MSCRRRTRLLAFAALSGFGLLATADAPRAAPDLLWPTNAGRCITSSFCEFRPGHFHSGIDVATWGKTGYSCFAVADGDIVRARVSCGGYGRALYLRLEDGRTAVYAHLSRFQGALTDTVRARRTESGTSYFDQEFALGTFPVKRGDVIASTGESGAGAPHLHFEIRDASERPMDPMLHGFAVEDTSSPTIRRLALTPLSAASSVDGSTETVVVDVEDGEGGPRVSRIVPVQGRIGIAVEVDETTDTCRYRLAPSRLELREGEETLYALEYERFAFHETGLIDLQIDPRFSATREGRFHNLWIREGNDLPWTTGEWASRGIVAREDSSGSEHVRRLTVVAKDAAGNRGSAGVTLSFAPPPEVTALSAERGFPAGRVSDDTVSFSFAAWEDTVDVEGVVAARGRDVREIRFELSTDAGRSWVPGGNALVGPEGAFRTRIPIAARVPGTAAPSLVVRAWPVDTLGQEGMTRSVGVEPGEPAPLAAPAVETVTRGGWVEFQLDGGFPFGAAVGGCDSTALVEGGSAETEVVVRPHGRGLALAYAPAHRGSAVKEWSGLGPSWRAYDAWGRPVALRLDVPGFTAAAGASGTARAADGLAAFAFRPDTVRERVVAVVTTEPAPSPSSELVPVGSLYSLRTGGVPLAGKCDVTLRAGESVEGNAERVGIFALRRGEFSYIGGERSDDEDVWTTRTRPSTPIGLFEDRVAPTIGPPKLVVVESDVEFRCMVGDSGAGIRCRDITVLYRGDPVPHEFDEETGLVEAFPGLPVEFGAGGIFEVRLADRCGNEASLVEVVRVEEL